MTAASFPDHFSAVAAQYAQARPEYPQALFDWIASIAPTRELAWEAGCGSGQASRDLAPRFAQVLATDLSVAQIAQAHAPGNVRFAVEPAERCGLGSGVADAVCVAQALHWFDQPAFFSECARVLKPRGVLVAWGYQDIEVPDVLAEVNAALQDEVRDCWPPQRASIDAAYADVDWPFPRIDVPRFEMTVDWPLSRLLGYYASYSATKRHIESTGRDPVAMHASRLADAWGDPDAKRTLRWPLFMHAGRKPG